MRAFALSAALAFVTAQTARADVAESSTSFGVGLQAGSPTALTLKLSGIDQAGVVLGVGAGFDYGAHFGASLSLHADYITPLTIVDNGTAGLRFYGGPGLWLSLFGSGYGLGYFDYAYFHDYVFAGLGVRVPLGLSLAISHVELYAEIDPALWVFPDIDLAVGGSLGFRFYF